MPRDMRSWIEQLEEAGELIRIADETEINAFVIDIKESDTYLSFVFAKRCATTRPPSATG